MNPKLDKFIKSMEVKKSILYAQKDEIFELRRLGYSFENICIYLKTVGINTSKQNLSKWVKRQNKNITKPDDKQKSSSTTTTLSQEESMAKLLQSTNKKFAFDDLMKSTNR